MCGKGVMCTYVRMHSGIVSEFNTYVSTYVRTYVCVHTHTVCAACTHMHACACRGYLLLYTHLCLYVVPGVKSLVPYVDLFEILMSGCVEGGCYLMRTGTQHMLTKYVRHKEHNTHTHTHTHTHL